MVILLHGFNCNPSVWDGLVKALSVDMEVAAPSLPWHSGDRDDDVEMSVEGLADAVAARHLDEAAPAVVVGHSLGGMVGLQIARRHPRKIRGLALVDAFPSLALNDEVLPGTYGPDTPPEISERARKMMERGRDEMPSGVNERIWASIKSMDATPWLADIRVPLLGIYGGRGRKDADGVKRELGLDRVKDAEFVLVPHAAHFLMWEAPVLLESSLRSFFSRIP